MINNFEADDSSDHDLEAAFIDEVVTKIINHANMREKDKLKMALSRRTCVILDDSRQELDGSLDLSDLEPEYEPDHSEIKERIDFKRDLLIRALNNPFMMLEGVSPKWEEAEVVQSADGKIRVILTPLVGGMTVTEELAYDDHLRLLYYQARMWPDREFLGKYLRRLELSAPDGIV